MAAASTEPCTPLQLNYFTFAAAALASTTSLFLGYDIGVMSGAILFIQEDLHLSSTHVEILLGCLNAFSLLGSLLAGKTSDLLGRRLTVVLSAVIFLAGALIMAASPSFPLLLAGRLVAGLGVGYSLVIGPVYAAELSPATTRGFLSSLPEIFITFGILLGYLSNLAFSDLKQSLNWRLMLGVAAAPAAVFTLPESPRWLAVNGRIEEANNVLKKTSITDEESSLRISEISRVNRSTDKGWKELLIKPSPAIRRILIAAVGINFFMQASGNDAIVYYTPEVFRRAGIRRRRELVGITVIMGMAKTSFALCSALFLDRVGRRPLLLLGSVGICISLAVLGMGCMHLEKMGGRSHGWVVVICVVAVCCDVAFFSVGLGPITWVYSSEVFPTRVRGEGSSVVVCVNRLTSGLVSMTFLSASKRFGFGGVFVGLSGLMGLGSIFFYFFLPETKGKKLEEIETLFEKKAGECTRGVVKDDDV